MSRLIPLLLLLGCQASAPPSAVPAGMVRLEGGTVQVLPDAPPATLAPFFVDIEPASQDGGPAVSVPWDQARARCAERGLRLPTDAEWQHMIQTPGAVQGLEDSVFQWTATAYSPPPGEPEAPEMRGQRRVVRGACCPFMSAWRDDHHRAAYPQDRQSRWIGYRCAGPATPAVDANLELDDATTLPPSALDEGEAIRQLLAGLWGPDRQPTDPAVRALIDALPPGAAAADVGCGLGALSLELAQAVGPEGRVFAVDIEPELLSFVRAMAQTQRAGGIQTVLGAPDDAGLAPACCDLVLLYDMANSLREDDLPGFASSLAQAVAPGGSLAVYHLPGPPPPRAALEALASQGLVLTQTERDPTSSPADPDQRAEKLWVFARP